MRKTIRFKANPMQKVFIEHRPFDGFELPSDWPEDVKPQVVDLFSCRMGEGKSAGLCWAVYFYTRFNPGARTALIRGTWEQMRDTTLVEFLKWFEHMGRYIKSEKRFIWTAEGMDGEVSFMGMDEEKDADKLQSREFGMFGMDEPSPAAGTGGIEEMIFKTALTRLRQPGMNWYAAKLAQNNPDENHWTYTNFVKPGNPDYTHFQTVKAENEGNLPPGYYTQMRKDLEGREDLQRRFVDGEFGFQSLGVKVTPAYNEKVHLVSGLKPMQGVPLYLGWDGYLNPVCTIVQLTPTGVLHILECLYGSGMGVSQLIDEQVYPALDDRYRSFAGSWKHITDPSMSVREQSDSDQSGEKVIRQQLGGKVVPGEKMIEDGLNPLNRRLSMLHHGGGMVLVDKDKAEAVHYAFRGGWHFPRHANGVVGTSPVKNHPHSDVGDSVRYLASKLFPAQGGVKKIRKSTGLRGVQAMYSGSGRFSFNSLRQRKRRLPEEFRNVD